MKHANFSSSADGQQNLRESAHEREYNFLSSPFEPTCASTPHPFMQQLRQLEAKMQTKDLAMQELQEQNLKLQERNAALEATIVLLSSQKSNLTPPTAPPSNSPVGPSSREPADVSTPAETKSLFSMLATPFKGFWGSSTKTPSPIPDIKVATSMEAKQIPSLKPNSSRPQHKSPRTPSRPIHRAKSHTHNTSKTVTFNVVRPRANSEDLEQAAPTPATVTREPWQIFSYRRRRGQFLEKWEAWQLKEQARIRSGLPETDSEQKQRRNMESQKALVDQAIAHSKKQQAINKAKVSATPQATPRLTVFNVGVKRNADTVVTNEGSPMKKQRLAPKEPIAPSSVQPQSNSPSPAPKEREQQPSPGRTFEAPSADDEDMSEEVSIGRTFAFPDYSSSDSEDDSMEEAEVAGPAEPAEAPAVSEATQKKRKLVEDEEQELARREEENARRALRIAETEKELNRLHAEQVEKQKAAAATPSVPAWTQPPPPTPSPQHAQLPKPAPAPAPASIPAPQNKYAPKKPSRLRESTTYSPVRQSVEVDVITIPTPQQHGSLFGARYPTPPDDELEQGMQALLSVVKFVSPLSGR